MLARLDIVVDHERCVASKEDKIGQTLVHDRTHLGEKCGHISPPHRLPTVKRKVSGQTCAQGVSILSNDR